MCGKEQILWKKESVDAGVVELWRGSVDRFDGFLGWVKGKEIPENRKRRKEIKEKINWREKK